VYGTIGINPADVGAGVVTGVELGGAATPLLALTPLAPVAVVAPVLGALVGAVAGGLSFPGARLTEESKAAIYAPIAALQESANASDNPYALDAIADAALEMTRQVDQFAARNADALDPSDTVTVSTFDALLDNVRRGASAKAATLRASGKLGMPTPVDAAQKTLEAAAAAIAKAAEQAVSMQVSQARMRTVAAAVVLAVGATATWWWMHRRPSPSSR